MGKSKLTLGSIIVTFIYLCYLAAQYVQGFSLLGSYMVAQILVPNMIFIAIGLGLSIFGYLKNRANYILAAFVLYFAANIIFIYNINMCLVYVVYFLPALILTVCGFLEVNKNTK